MRSLLVAVFCVAVAGCDFGAKTCNVGTECPSGVCESGFCVAGADSGGGGGGGVSAGGGGGAVGGGGGGGTTSDCPSGCEAWQTCQPGNGGTCRSAQVSIVSPADFAVYGGGTSARVVARVTDWDGGLFPRSGIPASATAGVVAPAELTLTDAGLFVGDYELPDIGGTHTLTAGWAAAKDTVDVVTQVCSVSCADWEECLPNADGGTCGDLALSLNWDVPTEDFKYAPSTSVPLSLSVSRADGGPFTKPVPFTVSGGDAGTLTMNAGSWTGSVASGTSDARRLLEAGWADGGPAHAVRHFLVDATPPLLGLVVASDGGAYQRDAIIPAVLTSNEALGDAGVMLGGVAMQRVTNGNCPNFGSVTGAAACFELDFSKPVLRALDGGFTAALEAIDLYSNSGPGDGGVLPVTRLRWVASPTTHQVQALAVGSEGTLYGGTSTNGGELFKISPSGDSGSPVSLGAIQSLAVSPGPTADIVYAAYNTATVGSIGAVESATLTRGTLRSACEGATGSATYSGLALYRPSTETLAVGSVNSVLNDGTGCLYRPSSGPAVPFGGTTTLDAAPVSATVAPTTASNVAILGTTASFLRQDSSGAWWQPVTLSGISTPTIGSPAQLTALALAPALGQAISSAQFLIGTTNSGNGKEMFVVSPSGGLDGGSLGSNTDKGVPVLASASVGYVGQGDALVRFDPTSLSTLAIPVGAVSSDTIRTSPVLGAPRVSGGVAEGFAISTLGTLLAFSQANGSELWRASLLSAGDSVKTHMAFDCNRASPTTKTGLLYVGAASGKVLSIVVDSPRLLDTAGAWPKYQRTMGNAGNDDTTNFPTNWASCP